MLQNVQASFKSARSDKLHSIYCTKVSLKQVVAFVSMLLKHV